MAASRVIGTGKLQGLAMKWGNAHGVKVPTEGSPLRRKLDLPRFGGQVS